MVSAINGRLLDGHYASHRSPASVVLTDLGFYKLDSELFDYSKQLNLERIAKILC